MLHTLRFLSAMIPRPLPGNLCTEMPLSFSPLATAHSVNPLSDSIQYNNLTGTRLAAFGEHKRLDPLLEGKVFDTFVLRRDRCGPIRIHDAADSGQYLTRLLTFLKAF